MNVEVENQEKNMAKLTVEIDADRVEQAIDQAYKRQKNRISIPGFRKGKVPRAMVEKMYGVEIFYEDAANILIREEYPNAYDESGLKIVSQPEIEVVQIEKGKPFIFTAEVAVKPEIKLGKYKGIELSKQDISVTAEDIDAEIEQERKNNSRTVEVTDRAIADGDTAVIDFEGFTDGKPFAGGKGEDYSLVIGSHSFIDNFEDQLIGKEIGDDVDVNVTFPEEYQEASLAGKPALFKVKIKGIKVQELPELDDEFVGDVSEEAETVEDYKKEIEARLIKRKEEQARSAKETEALTKIVEDSEMEIPDPMVDSQVDTMLRDYSMNMRMSGLSFDQYLSMTGMTLEQFKNQMRPDALDTIKNSLVLEAVAEKEKFEVTDEEIDERIDEMAKQYYMSGDDLRKNIGDDERKQIGEELSVKKALDFIIDNAKEAKK